MSVALASILEHPSNRERIRKAAEARLRAMDAEAQAQEAERRAAEDQKAAINHAAEMEKIRLGPVPGHPYASPAAEGCIYWFNTWVWTYNPKLVGTKNPDGTKASPYIPFRLFARQEALVRWTFDRLAAQEQGAVPKSRDVGASYIFTGVALHQWLTEDGFSATFGSRIMDNVDKADNPDALFEKLRIMRRRLPAWMLPKGFSESRDDKYGLLVNRVTGATISGEGGENMGRAGRSTMFVLDEAAFVPNADAVEAALSGNTDCIFWVSSANGLGNLFHRKATGDLPPDQVFRLHYSDDPRKTPEWVAAKKESLKSNPVAWASEYEIDFSASLEGVCIPAAWVASSQALRRRLKPTPRPGGAIAGGDVGAGKARSVLVTRNGPWVRPPHSRGDPDTIDTAHWMVALAKLEGVVALNYDAPGVGSGVTAAMRRIPPLANGDPDPLEVYAINTGVPPSLRVWPDKRTSKDTFGNAKAEIWWMAKTGIQKAHELLLFMDGLEGGVEHDLADVILLPSGDPESERLAAQLSMVKQGQDEKGKIVIEKKAALAKRGIPSPDHADAFVLTFAERRSRYRIDALA